MSKRFINKSELVELLGCSEEWFQHLAIQHQHIGYNATRDLKLCRSDVLVYDSSENLITTTAAAARYGCNPSYIRALVSKGTLQAQRLGRDFLVKVGDVSKLKQASIQKKKRRALQS